MAIEKFNSKPHHDNPHHAGRHSHEMRKQAAEYELDAYLNSLPFPEFIDLVAEVYDWNGQLSKLRYDNNTSLINEETDT